MGRIRSRQLESQSIPERVIRPGSVRRGHIARWAVGKDQILPGAVGEVHIGPQAIRQQHVDPDLIPREAFAFEPDAAAVVACESADYPVRRGGKPLITAQLRTAPTGDLEITAYRNGVALSPLVVVPDGELYAEVSFNDVFAPGDLARSEVTDPAADAEWLVIRWTLR